MKPFFSKYKLEIIIFSLAICVRLALFFINLNAADGNFIGAIHGDDGYYEISQGLVNGHGFSGSTTFPFKPDPLRPPVWPFTIAFLVKIFGNYLPVLIFEIIIGSLIPVLGMLIARKLFSSKSVWLGTGILLSIEPYGVLLSTILYTETMFTFLFLLFFIFVIRYFENKSLRNIVWMTVFLSLATLVKPTLQYIPIILALVLVFSTRGNISKKVFGHILVTIGLFFIMISPWIYRNYIEFGKIGMSAQPAFNLYVYLQPTVLAIDNKTNFKTELDIILKKDNLNVNDINLSNSSYYQSQALSVILDHKVALMKSVATTIVTFFTHDGMLTVFQNAGIVIPVTLSKPALTLLLTEPMTLFSTIGGYIKGAGGIILLVRFIWILISIFFIVGIFLFIRNKEYKKEYYPIIFMALFLVVYFALTTSINGLGVNARFKVPVNTFIFSFALYGLFSLKRYYHTWSIRNEE